MPLPTNSWWSSFHDAIVRYTISIWSHSDWLSFTKWTICLNWWRYYTCPWHVSLSWSEKLIFSKTSNFLPSLSGGSHVNDYLSVMKTLCIHLYGRMVETETVMNSFVYIRIMVKYIFTNMYIIGHVFDKHKSFNCNSTFAVNSLECW